MLQSGHCLDLKPGGLGDEDVVENDVVVGAVCDLNGRARALGVVDGVVNDDVVMRGLGAIALKKRNAGFGGTENDVVPGHTMDDAVQIDGCRPLAVANRVALDPPVGNQAITSRAEIRIDLDAIDPRV